MAFNPNDLLIFQGGEENSEDVKKKQPPKTASQQKQQESTPVQQQLTKSQQQMQQKQQQQPQPQPQKEDSEVQTIEFPGQDINDAALSTTLGHSDPSLMKKQVVKTARLKAKESRKIASHMTCELHPWRRAYAICDYCHRAFCYEDVVEEGGVYYDLEDIDKIPMGQRKSYMIKYTNLSLISAAMFMVIFLIYLYYSYTTILQLPQVLQISTKGLAGAISALSLTQDLEFAQLAVALLSLASGILILLSTRSSFAVSGIAGIAMMIVFSYGYITQNMLYLMVIAVVSFVALIVLAYARVSSETLPEENLDGDSFVDIAKSSF